MEGDGLIQQASVRTDAFLADNTPAGHGIGEIELNGENGLELKLAGNIKNVVNRTPESALSISSGRVDTITVDEKAVDSTLEISSGAEADHVNLDVGTTVTGDGDIGDLVVNAPGSNVSMLPDQIVIRPGIRPTSTEKTWTVRQRQSPLQIRVCSQGIPKSLTWPHPLPQRSSAAISVGPCTGLSPR